jgi:methylase of polypeptide subunit release factors
MVAMDAKCRALIEIGRILQSRGYRFVAVSPMTHDRVLRREAATPSLESVFGWSRPFDRRAIDGYLIELLEQADALEVESDRYRSKVRFATIDDLLFVHSAFPTTEPDSVFFGPDSYRFARLLRAALSKVEKRKALRLVDIGAGSGAGGIYAARTEADDHKCCQRAGTCRSDRTRTPASYDLGSGGPNGGIVRVLSAGPDTHGFSPT